MDFKIEVVFLPVSDVDRAKDFYERCGFNADHDQRVHESLRFVQMTPPGSACSIAFGEGLVDSTPGAVKGTMIVVDDVEAARDQLVAAGIEVAGIDKQEWGSFAYFADPDGNSWTVQQLPAR